MCGSRCLGSRPIRSGWWKQHWSWSHAGAVHAGQMAHTSRASASLVCTKDLPQDRWEDEVGCLRKSSVSVGARGFAFLMLRSPFPLPYYQNRAVPEFPAKRVLTR